MPKAELQTAKELLDEVCQTIPKKWSHATDLSHTQTVFWSRSAATLNVRFFAVISNKSTLGQYASIIEKSPDKFYNKCTVYLLEKVGKYLSMKGMAGEPPDVCFERRNHDYDALRRYVVSIKETPHHKEAEYLRVCNPFAFFERGKDEEPLLKYADLAAHAAYQCANKSHTNFSIPETRYFSELSKRFGADQYGRIMGTGLKCIHSMADLKLDVDVETTLKSLKALPMKRS